ncbi:hypothetical protein CSC70_08430 [Pseudoxanthomonas kalamensis DSM 18571]|uniref:hypothetical protein n=1 Tax=Pseudoxanthomonas kalamensis TaxID=289483 RepID=UPI001391B21F|nr:hypothetical protein [Pseudoxanthomonas kalamensis]KAF1710665.1 hypothetical protein CSC70_08430 [Pseudoxanthomonas kalamensis DSM 18571]
MDFDAISALDELLLGACLLLLPAVFLAFFAHHGRRTLVAAPGLLSFVFFSLTFAHLHLADASASEFTQWAYCIGLAVAALLIPLSVLNLRNRWLGFIHLITAAGILWSLLIGSLLLVRDSM